MTTPTITTHIHYEFAPGVCSDFIDPYSDDTWEDPAPRNEPVNRRDAYQKADDTIAALISDATDEVFVDLERMLIPTLAEYALRNVLKAYVDDYWKGRD